MRHFVTMVDRPDGPPAVNVWSPAAPAGRFIRRVAKFHAVGLIGVAVQLAALVLFKSVAGLNYLAATALAVEVSEGRPRLPHGCTGMDRGGPRIREPQGPTESRSPGGSRPRQRHARRSSATPRRER
ncbi:MAG: GtrA family protein [Bryobacterales bacterium]|nr:GtrA family protein [Bryobacterales bacterium]